ncbi:hypothetical protein [Streptomyces sp. NPDC059979]|uniref:hypothetical protein n=1 Tax=Streptomyces sp. NPDC059979 TaxID=3347021 RepID=UPI0036CC205E
MDPRPVRHAGPAPAYVVPAPAAPLIHQPRPYVDDHQAVILPAPAAERRALVQLDNGSWVAAYVPAAPPVLLPAAPEAGPRRGLTVFERAAVTVVGSLCSLALAGGIAMNLAGPYLAAAADLAIGAAVLLGTTVAGFLGLRLLRPASSAAASAPTSAPAPVTVNVTGTGGQGGRWGSRGGVGVHIDRINIQR